MYRKKKIKQKLGKPEGSKSFINIQLRELRKYVTNQSIVVVSRVWLENMGLSVEDMQEVEEGKDVIIPQATQQTEVKPQEVSPEEKITFKVDNFTDSVIRVPITETPSVEQPIPLSSRIDALEKRLHELQASRKARELKNQELQHAH